MNSPTPPLFVWYSTRESRAAGIVSLLAVAETVTCVALYWLLWLKWGVTWHHWLIVVATPLVLMRSESSITKGLLWFGAYFEDETENSHRYIKRIASVTLPVAFSVCVAWFLAQNWLAEMTGWPLIWRSGIVWVISLNIGVAAGAMVTIGGSARGTTAAAIAAVLVVTQAVALTGGVAAVMVLGLAVGVVIAVSLGVGAAVALMGVGGALGLWFRAVLTRSLATFSHPLDGLHAIPTNWRFFVWNSDLRDPPELLPDHVQTSFLSFSNAFKQKVPREVSDYLVYLILLSFVFLPTLLWRWSIKSTAWFYIPLLWVGRGWQDIHGQDLLIWAKGYSRKWINITGFLLAAFLLGFSLVALIMPVDLFDLQQTLRDAGAPLPVIGLVLVMDWQSLAEQPWQWFYLPSWAITLILFFLIDDHGIDIEKGAKSELRLPALRRWMWISNARAALTNLGLLIALLYFLKAVDASRQVAALVF